MKKAVASLFLLSFFALYLPGQTNLSQSRVWSELPFVIAMPNGEVMVAWTEGSFNEAGIIMYRIYSDASGWSGTQVAVYPENGSAAFPQMAIDAEGDVHMAYHDGDGSFNREIFYKKYSNGVWSNGEMVGYSPGLNSSWPRIDVEGNRIYILWCHNYTPPGDGPHRLDIVLMEKDDGGQWPSSHQNVSNLPDAVSVHPFIQVNNGNVYAAWMDDNHDRDNWNIYYNERINGNWGNSLHLNPGDNQYIPAMAVDDNGDIHLIYSGKGNPIFYQKKTAQGWTSPKVISTLSTSVTTMIFLKYKYGYLHGVWRQADGEGDNIFYSRGTVNGQWETPIPVSTGEQGEYTVCDVDTQGRVHVVYSDMGTGGYRDVYHAIAGQTEASPFASFTASPTQGAPPLAVYFDASSSYDPNGQITEYRWDFGDGMQGTGLTTSHTFTNVGTYTATLTIRDEENNTASASKTITVGTPPVASFTASPSAGPSPLTVRFDASASYAPNGQIQSYRWDFGDGTSGDGITVNHTYTAKGTRTARLTVRDTNGLESSATQTIEITDNIVASFTATPMNGVPPLSVNFDASGSKASVGASIVSYEWDFGENRGATGQKVSYTYNTGGKYTVTLRVTDSRGYSDSATKLISVFYKPTAQFAFSPENGAIPLSVDFDASASSDRDGQIVLYSWDFGDGNFATGERVSHIYTQGGTYTITLCVFDNDENMDLKTAEIVVREKPYPPLDITVNIEDKSGLFVSAYLAQIAWKSNPLNSSFNIVKYRIYRKKGDESTFSLLDEVNGTTFQYTDSIFAADKSAPQYSYAVSTVDENDRESELGIPQVQNSSTNSKKNNLKIVK